jgi:hypothetical protein
MLNTKPMEKKIEKKNAGFKESADQVKSPREAQLHDGNAFYVFSGEDRKKKKWDPTLLYF